MMRASGNRARKPLERRLDRGRMVREIIVNGDAADHAAHLHAPLDPAELAERERRALGRHADVIRRGDRRERVHDVVLAEERPAHAAPTATAARAAR